MNNKITRLLIILLATMFITGCSSSDSSKDPVQPDYGYYQKGIASWYGSQYHNRRTASGELFDKNALTAAHKTLSFGTWVMVTNIDNGYRVTVKINDRGPNVENRIIDVSEKAASELRMKDAGLAKVTLHIVGGP